MSSSRSLLADFSADKRVILLCLIAAGIGLASSFIAVALLWLIAVISNLAFFQKFSSTPMNIETNGIGPWVILLPVIGSLVIGLMARYGSSKIRGHGIPEALEAILLGRSKLDLKVAILKPLSSAISIGTGGPFGAEGPIIMTGGAFGSLFAQMFRLSANERKTLLVAGAAAGMSAVFATPVAAILLAVELLLFEWKPRSMIPVTIASFVAASARATLLGHGPIFSVAPHHSFGEYVYLSALAIGLVSGLVSSALTLLVYFFEDWFQKLPIHWMWWPAVGGLIVGIGGWLDLRVMGVGYDIIHGELLGVTTGLLGLLILKSLVWSVSLGSGTSGGVLAPLLMIGGATGALLSGYLLPKDPALWALIGMAALMGGTMRAPFTAAIFALELTNDFQALPLLMIASVASLTVTVLLMRRSILTEKIARRGHHITREYAIDPFELSRVRDVMDVNPPLVADSTLVADVCALIENGNREIGKRQALFVVNKKTELQGVVTREDLLLAMQNGAAQKTITSVATTSPIVTYPDELLRDALAKMLNHKLGRLPVVDPDSPLKIQGYLGRAEILAAQLRRFEEETVPSNIRNIHAARHEER
jgi:chloride channel protein, CIC family